MNSCVQSRTDLPSMTKSMRRMTDYTKHTTASTLASWLSSLLSSCGRAFRGLSVVREFGYSSVLQAAVLALVVGVIGVHVYERVVPMSEYFVLEKVEPVSSIYRGEELLKLRTHYEIFQTSSINYLNILYCDHGGGIEYVSRWPAFHPNIKPHSGIAKGLIWTYGGRWPNQAGECYVEVSADREMQYAEREPVTINSEMFRYEP